MKRSRGFTLIELLVGVMTYAAENNDCPPFATFDDTGDGVADAWTEDTAWSTRIGIKQGDVFLCPSHERPFPERVTRSYLINGRIAPMQDMTFQWSLGNFWMTGRNFTVPFHAIQDMQTILLSETHYRSVGSTQPLVTPTYGTYTTVGFVAVWDAPSNAEPKYGDLPHRDHVSAAFVDGCAGALTPEMTDGGGFALESHAATGFADAGKPVHNYAVPPGTSPPGASTIAHSIWTPQKGD